MILCIPMRPTAWCWAVSSVTSLLNLVNNILSYGLWKEIAYCFELNMFWVDNLILIIKWYYLLLIDLNFEIPLKQGCVFAGNHYVSATPPVLPHTLVIGVLDGVFTLGTTSYCSLSLSLSLYYEIYTPPFGGATWFGLLVVWFWENWQSKQPNSTQNQTESAIEMNQPKPNIFFWIGSVWFHGSLFSSKTKWTSILKSRNRCKGQKKRDSTHYLMMFL